MNKPTADVCGHVNHSSQCWSAKSLFSRSIARLLNPCMLLLKSPVFSADLINKNTQPGQAAAENPTRLCTSTKTRPSLKIMPWIELLGQLCYQFIMEFLFNVIKKTWLLPPDRTDAKNTYKRQAKFINTKKFAHVTSFCIGHLLGIQNKWKSLTQLECLCSDTEETPPFTAEPFLWT